MPNRCGCSGSCSCLIVAGEGVSVEGIGTIENPYEISSEASELLERIDFVDTSTVDFTTVGVGTTSDPMSVTAQATLAMTDLTDVEGTPGNEQVPVWVDDHWEFQDQSGGGGGTGLPPGGTDGQVLTKQSDVDGDALWETITGGGGGGSAVVEPVYSSSRRQLAAVSMTNNTQTAIPWDTEDYTDGIPFANSVFTIPVAGYYQVTVGIASGVLSSGVLQTRIMVNGAPHSSASFPWVAANGSSSTTNRVLKLNAGDTVQLNCLQNSGATVSLTTTNGFNWVNITKVPSLAAGGGGVVVERPMASMRRHAAATSILNATVTAIPFDTSVYEDGITWSAPDAAFIVPSDGYYQVDCGVTYAINATGVRIAYPSLNGSGYATIQDEGTVGAVAGSVTMKCLAGDKISLRTQQTSGVSLALAGSPTYTYISVTKVPQSFSGSAVSTYGEQNYATVRKQTATVSVANSTFVAMPWDTVETDGNIPYATPIFTVPVAGYYTVTAEVIFPAHATGYRQIRLLVNGGTHSATNMTGTTSTGETTLALAKTILLAAGDALQMNLFQTSGAAMTINASPANNFISIAKVPAPVINGAAASGVWGVGPLTPAKAGSNDLAGEVIYIDSKGQLRGAPPRLDTPYVARSKSVSQALTAANTYYVITFDVEDSPGGGITYSNGVFTVPEDGVYHLDANLLCGGAAAVQMRMSITVTPTVPGGSTNMGVPATNGAGNSMLTFSRAIRMVAGATLTISAFANATGQNITGSGTNYTTMSLTKIAP